MIVGERFLDDWEQWSNNLLFDCVRVVVDFLLCVVVYVQI